MKVVIAKVDQVFYDGEAASLIAPGSDGQLTILTHHMPLVTTLKEGELVVKEKEGSEHRFPLKEGVLEVHHNGATVIL